MVDGIDRREFLKFTGAGLMGGCMIALISCGDSRSGGSTTTTTTPTPTPSPTTTVYSDKSGNISANHGHSVVLTAAQQQAGQRVDLTLVGTDSTFTAHTHVLTFLAADVTAIAAGNRVTGTSTVDLGHSHGVTFN